MAENISIRIDKFLWSVRIYKTRSIASNACSKGKIIINNIPVKPSRLISKDEIIQVKKPPVIYTYRILEPIGNRLSAKLVEKYIEDITPDEEKAKLEVRQSVEIIFREKGSGRPTKRDRRVIDKLKDDFNDL
ncbi:MAG TPA: S4 domain-containing protein [Bacteroidales bacterium]|nr:S4 domain-containing protein [Bacteroidales bacterium]